MATLTRITPSGPGYATAAECKAAIIAEAIKQHGDAGGRPLPLTSNYAHPSTTNNADDQYALIEAGYPLLPRLHTSPSNTVDATFLTTNNAISDFAADGLPIMVDIGLIYVTGDFCGYGPGPLGATLPGWNTYSEADTAECVFIRNVAGAVAVGSTSITITTDFAHYYRNGRPVRFENMPGDWAVLNSGTYTVSGSSGLQFSIAMNASGWSAYTSGGSCVGRPYQMSPWGTAVPWEDLGEAHATTVQADWFQAQYPNPPRIIYWSNDEFQISSGNTGATADYDRVQLDPRYRALYPDWASRTDLQRMTDLSERCISQYTIFNDSLRANFTEPAWQTIQHVKYNGMPLRVKDCYNWFRWQYGGIYDSTDFDKVHWSIFGYDGVSPEVYDNPSQTKSAFRQGWSMQNEAMTFRWQRDMAESNNPDFWFEAIAWDGYLWGDNYNSIKAALYRSLTGLSYSPEYYKGWTQYCLWILQPRQWRQFSDTLPAEHMPYWQVIIDQVSHIHSDPTLKRFWRSGTLVENPVITGTYPAGCSATHCYGARTYWGGDWALPNNGAGLWCGYPKQYHLYTSVDPPTTFGPLSCASAEAESASTYRPIWTLAYVLGTAPTREWLIYAHSTGISGATLTNVAVTIPDFDTVTLPEVPVEGAFYLLVEGSTSQTAHPDSDISSTGWIAVPTGNPYSCIDEAFAALDDADYCYSNTPGSVLQVGLEALTDPLTDYGAYMRYRGAGIYTVRLFQSDTVTMAVRSHVDVGLTTHFELLTPAEVALITDWEALSVAITAG